MLFVAGIAFEPSVEGKSNSNANRHAYSYACADAVHCCANTCTDGESNAN
jgi:hypothetical protein